MGHRLKQDHYPHRLDVQQRLFEVGAQLGAPGRRRITDEDVQAVEQAVELFNRQS